jgi:hypothetical protein
LALDHCVPIVGVFDGECQHHWAAASVSGFGSDEEAQANRPAVSLLFGHSITPKELLLSEGLSCSPNGRTVTSSAESAREDAKTAPAFSSAASILLT